MAVVSIHDTHLAPGLWGDTLSHHIVGGILGRSIEAAVGDPELRPARLTVDLFPVGLCIGLAATGQFSTAGVASGTATIFDDRGRPEPASPSHWVRPQPPSNHQR